VPLHGQLSQPMRLSALHKFKSGERNVLLATDVASRGLDIPSGETVTRVTSRSPRPVASAVCSGACDPSRPARRLTAVPSRRAPRRPRRMCDTT
jgi:hypothetical protein